MKRKAFTLLEILIVIGIIGLLAIIAVANFGTIRKSAELNISIDSVENFINRTRDGASLGKTLSSEPTKSSCWILHFSTTGDKKITQLTSPYIRSTQKCDLKSATESASTPLTDTTTQLFQIGTDNNKNQPKEIVIIFKPPRAEIEIKETLQSITTISPRTIELSLGFENDQDSPEKWQTLQIQTLTGESKKITPNQ